MSERCRILLRTGILPLGGAAWLLFAGTTQVRAGFLPTLTNRVADRAQADTMSQQAFTDYQAGDLAGAVRLLDEADKIKPNEADAWNLRGAIYLKQKDFDKAEAAFSRAVAIDPTLWAAQFNQAEAPFQKKDFARARTLFDHLLAHTDRYKSSEKWELVAYKSFLAALLSGDEGEAQKRLARLPATGGKTPALQYAQAALAFQRKDAAGARKIVASAQTQFPPGANDLFSPGLEVAGWQVPSPPAFLPGAMPGIGLPGRLPTDPATVAAMNAAGVTNPGTLYLPPLPAGMRPDEGRPAVIIDPRAEAAAAEPLPSAPGNALRPVVGQLTLPGPDVSQAPPVVRHGPTDKVAGSPTVTVGSASTVNFRADSGLDHSGLLLDIN